MSTVYTDSFPHQKFYSTREKILLLEKSVSARYKKFYINVELLLVIILCNVIICIKSFARSLSMTYFNNLQLTISWLLIYKVEKKFC